MGHIDPTAPISLEQGFDEFVAAWDAGEAPVVRATLARVTAGDRDELADALGKNLVDAPTPDLTGPEADERGVIWLG